MQSILARSYPSMNMDRVCKICRGNCERTMDRFRCPLCKMRGQDYKDAGLSDEVDLFRDLFLLWLEVKRRNKPTTGYKKLDNLLEVVFGKPHNNEWRNYARFPTNESPYVVLRTVRLSCGS